MMALELFMNTSISPICKTLTALPVSGHDSTPAACGATDQREQPDISFVLFCCQQTALRWIFHCPWQLTGWCWARIVCLARSVLNLFCPSTKNL
jgi:hypothetical protein